MVISEDLEKNFTNTTTGDDLGKVTSDDDVPPAIAARRRIRYVDDDDGPNGDDVSPGEIGYPLRRRASSFSIHSVQSMRSGLRTVDPALALPIQYRTISFNISQSKERQEAEAVDIKEAKKKAEGGKRQYHVSMPCAKHFVPP